MTILELVIASEERGMRLVELAAALEAPKSSVHALTRGLVSTGYLREEEGARYLVGPAVASLIAVAPEIAKLAYHQTLADLVAMWNETAMLAMLVGDSVVYVDCVQSSNLIRANPELNKRLTLWPRSAGKVFLSCMEPKRVESYLRRNHRDPDDAASVRDEIRVTRELGYGLNVGDTVAGHIGLAVPIILGQVPVATALTIAGPKARMEDRVQEIVKSMHEAAASLHS